MFIFHMNLKSPLNYTATFFQVDMIRWLSLSKSFNNFHKKELILFFFWFKYPQ